MQQLETKYSNLQNDAEKKRIENKQNEINVAQNNLDTIEVNIENIEKYISGLLYFNPFEELVDMSNGDLKRIFLDTSNNGIDYDVILNYSNNDIKSSSPLYEKKITAASFYLFCFV